MEARKNGHGIRGKQTGRRGERVKGVREREY